MTDEQNDRRLLWDIIENTHLPPPIAMSFNVILVDVAYQDNEGMD